MARIPASCFVWWNITGQSIKLLSFKRVSIDPIDTANDVDLLADGRCYQRNSTPDLDSGLHTPETSHKRKAEALLEGKFMPNEIVDDITNAMLVNVNLRCSSKHRQR